MIINFVHVSSNTILGGCTRDSIEHGAGLIRLAMITVHTSLIPRPSARRGKAWYTLFAHALDFPNIPGIPYHARISPRCYTSLSYTLA